MKRTVSLKLNILLAVILLLCGTLPLAAQDTGTDAYIPLHTEEELQVLLSRVGDYLEEHGSEIETTLNDTENQVVTNAFIRSWAVSQYEDAAPQASLETGLLFQYAAQLLDQEYYDLMAASGEDEETIEFAAYLRDLAEALVEDPESFSAEEVEENVLAIYQETYMAAGLKAIAHTEALPAPEELFGKEENAAMIPNPVVKYDTAEPLNEMLGIQMPELSEEYNAKHGYFSIVADIVAESEYEFPDGEKLIFRLCPETGPDISGVYGAEFYEDWDIHGTMTEVDKYQSMLIARGIVSTMDGKNFSFAVDADGIDEARFYSIVNSFIEDCMNRKAGK